MSDGNGVDSTTLSPAESIAMRVREGGRRGGWQSGVMRAERRERYENNEMNASERKAYEALLNRYRELGRKGGKSTAARRRREQKLKAKGVTKR